MWGCWGNPITATLISAKAGQYPGHYDAVRRYELTGLIGRAWGIDCVGLIKSYYWGCVPAVSQGKYDSRSDVSADGMYNAAKVKGGIETMPDLRGLCVQQPGHIGVYIGGGKVIEATRGVYGDGVVMTQLKDRKWVHWLQCPFITYETEEDELSQIIKQIAEKSGKSEDQVITALAVLARFANVDESGWEKDGVKYLKDAGLITADRDGRELVEFGELGVILQRDHKKK
jgi:DNA-binding transcriptional ArsR family regulator